MSCTIKQVYGFSAKQLRSVFQTSVMKRIVDQSRLTSMREGEKNATTPSEWLILLNMRGFYSLGVHIALDAVGPIRPFHTNTPSSR